MWRSTVAALGVAIVLPACGQAAHAPAHSHAKPPPGQAPSTSTPRTSTAQAHHQVRRRRPDPGRLPQTAREPSASTREFHRQMTALWQGIRTGRLGPALRAFFPESAYLQVKAITNPAADWHNRLVGGYAADIAAAHALLGAGASRAQLIGVRVPPGYAHWVPPNTCYNRVGYWESPNSRVVYREDGQIRSFGIASLISWRGVWYVVHLGAVLRSGSSGTVDDPSTGAGYSAPSSTC